MEIKVLKNVMIKNSAIGNDNRNLFLNNKNFVFNFISSPGAGKTTLLEQIVSHFKDKYKQAIIEGDLFTSKDAEKFQKFEIPLVQINTEGGCHLDARMIHEAIKNFTLNELDVIYIENVGNLVCPASFDLGEDLPILLLSVTEGLDKPQKYANIFRNAKVIIVTKCDLAPYCSLSLEELEKEIRTVNQTAPLHYIDIPTKKGFGELFAFLEKVINEK